MDLHHGHIDQLSTTSMLCIGMHPKLSQNILKQMLGEKRSTENADMLSLQMIDQKKKKMNLIA